MPIADSAYMWSWPRSEHVGPPTSERLKEQRVITKVNTTSLLLPFRNESSSPIRIIGLAKNTMSHAWTVIMTIKMIYEKNQTTRESSFDYKSCEIWVTNLDWMGRGSKIIWLPFIVMLALSRDLQIQRLYKSKNIFLYQILPSIGFAQGEPKPHKKLRLINNY